MRWTIQQVAHALGVAAPSGLDPVARLAGVSIDSRSVGPAELFIAIHGPRHDGHAFVEQVLSAGAGAAVVAGAKFAAYPAGVREKIFAVPGNTLRRFNNWRRPSGVIGAGASRLLGGLGRQNYN